MTCYVIGFRLQIILSFMLTTGTAQNSIGTARDFLRSDLNKLLAFKILNPEIWVVPVLLLITGVVISLVVEN